MSHTENTAQPAPTQSAELAELRKLAEKADPGPWEACREVDSVYNLLGYSIFTPSLKAIVNEHMALSEVNAMFIAAANPAAILRLLNELDMVRLLYEGAHADRMALAAAPAQTIADVSASSDCLHDDTVRQGVIWTACNQCGKRWADDEVAQAADVSAPTDEIAVALVELDLYRALYGPVAPVEVVDKFLGEPARAAAPVDPMTDKLLTIIAYAYQVAGAHDAPDHILDVLANPEEATDEQIEAMLPYVPAPVSGPSDA